MADKNFIGLDVGSYSIKLVQLERLAKGIKLTRYAVKRIPRNTIVKGEVVDQEGLRAALIGLLAEQKLRGVDVATALSGAVSETALAVVPSMSELELHESVEWEYTRNLSYRAQEGVFDHQVVEGRGVLLAGAKRDTVSRYLKVMRDAGLALSCVDVCALALTNAFGYNYESEGESCLLIHAGAEMTEVVVLEKGLPLFTRSVEGGGADVTAAIEAELGVGFEEAESLKRGGEPSSEVCAEAGEISNRVAEELVSKIRKSLDDFASLLGCSYGERVVLSGGCAKLPALGHQLRKQLSSKLELVNPFRRVDYRRLSPKKVHYAIPEAFVATGLALRGVARP